MKTVAILTALALGSAVVLASEAQAEPQRGGSMIESLKAADTNADGLLSRAEVAALPRLAENFDRIDANKDGQVSFDELKAARGAHGHRGHRGHHGGNMLKRMDADADGKVSKAEALAFATERFERADANHDGFVTSDEVKAQRHHRAAKVR